jgi:4-carboxymuconolactone decarboxylase
MSPDEQRRRGLAKMNEVYGWDMQDGPGDFFALTADHLFAEIWTRPGLSLRDRRLMLIGMLAGQGLTDVAEIQIGAALGNGELDADQLREVVIFLTHYVGWPLGAKLHVLTESLISKHSESGPYSSTDSTESGSAHNKAPLNEQKS